jgi:hypothetical protein
MSQSIAAAIGEGGKEVKASWELRVES